MEVVSASGVPLRGDIVTRVVMRTDLVPIPSTVEVTARKIPESTEALRRGAVIMVGGKRIPYRVVVDGGSTETGMQQGGREVAEISVTAVLDSCAALADPLQRSIFRERGSFADIYRSIGATATVQSDIAVPRFGAVIGSSPTMAVMRVLQEEAATVFLRDGKVLIRRLSDLVAEKAAITFPVDRTQRLESELLARHAIPFVVSTDEANGVVSTKREAGRAVVYWPRADTRVLNNMGTSLLTTRKMQQALEVDINAGDRIDVGGTPMVVVTAAHVFQAKTADADGEEKTVLWLGELRK